MQARDRMIKEEINFLIGQAEAATGLYDVVPRYELPRPVLRQHTTNVHNVKVDNSVVGAINTGSADKIRVVLNYMKKSGNAKLQESIGAFTQGVSEDKSLTEELKTEIADQLLILSGQLACKEELQSRGVIKALVAGIERVIANAANLVTLWAAVRQYLHF